jgi:zinc D-Ala-D-Ala carboxypeptidase
MKLSENLDLSEVTRSESAKRNGISNTPTPEHIENLKTLAENIFQPIRDHFKKPIRISSGYRSKELNTKVGGSSSSQHSKGQAIDIDMDGTDITNKQVFDFIKDNLPFDQLIYEFGDDNNPNWVHVSYNRNVQRKQVLKAFKLNNQTKYFPYI